MLNGLRVDVTASVQRPDRSVGLFDPYLDDFEISVRGKRAEWVEKRLKPRDIDIITEGAIHVWYEERQS